MAEGVEPGAGDYKVSLDVYSGPLDLLLYLIRRDEIDIYDIPIAAVTRQYLDYVEVLKALEPEVVGEFLVLAATLMEIKSRMLLPTPPVDDSAGLAMDPRQDLVRQLLEYKAFKDASRRLEEAADERAARFPRSPVLLGLASEETELDHVDVWDLFRAFKRLLEQVGQAGPVHRVTIDDTPLALHADDILDAIERSGGAQVFEDLFEGRTKAEMIGLFLAMLELIRQKRIRVSQDRPFGTIYLHLLSREPIDAAALERAWEPQPGSDDAELAQAALPRTASAGDVLDDGAHALGVDAFPTETIWGPDKAEASPDSNEPDRLDPLQPGQPFPIAGVSP